MEWIPETEPFLEYENLKDIINESIGTITLNKDYTKEFIEKVVDDIIDERYKQFPIDRHYSQDFFYKILNEYDKSYNIYCLNYHMDDVIDDLYSENGSELYKDYIDSWINNIIFLIVEDDFSRNSNAYSFIKDKKYCIFGDEGLDLGVILLYNPKKNRFLKNAITHELNHYYSEIKKYNKTHLSRSQNRKYYRNIDRDYRWWLFNKNSVNVYELNDIEKIEPIIKDLSDDKFPAVDKLNKLFVSMLYWMCDSEIAAHIENIFGDYGKWCFNNKYYPLGGYTIYKDLKSESYTLNVYSNIEYILEYIPVYASDNCKKLFEERYGKYYGYIFANSDKLEDFDDNFNFDDEFVNLKSIQDRENDLKMIHNTVKDMKSMVPSEDFDFDKEIKKRMEGKYYYNMSLMSLCKKLKKKVKYLRKHFNAITNYYLKQYDSK